MANASVDVSWEDRIPGMIKEAVGTVVKEVVENVVLKLTQLNYLPGTSPLPGPSPLPTTSQLPGTSPLPTTSHNEL